MQVAILHQNLKYLACLFLKQAVVGQDYCGAASGLERVHYMLDKVQLFVAGFNGEVVAIRRLVCSLGTKRRIGQHHVVALTPIRFIQCVAKIDVWLHPVKIKIHQSESTRTGHEVLTKIRSSKNPLGIDPVENTLAFCIQPLVSTDKETTAATGRVSNGEVLLASRVGLHYPA